MSTVLQESIRRKFVEGIDHHSDLLHGWVRAEPGEVAAFERGLNRHGNTSPSILPGWPRRPRCSPDRKMLGEVDALQTRPAKPWEKTTAGTRVPMLRAGASRTAVVSTTGSAGPKHIRH